MKTRKAVKKPIVIEFATYEEVVELICKDLTIAPKIGKYEIYAVFRTIENDKGEIKKLLVDEIHLQTLEGTMKFTKEDYLIIGVEGEIYPCKKNIFDKTYDIVED